MLFLSRIKDISIEDNCQLPLLYLLHKVYMENQRYRMALILEK